MAIIEMLNTRTNFHVKGLLSNRHIQSILASSKLRKKLGSAKYRPLIKSQSEIILNADNDIKLHSLYSSARSETNFKNKLVILIHGWEGSAESTYLLSAASYLFNAGFSVLRFHLRDHGPSAHLNTDLFHAARLNEVMEALKDCQNRLNYAKYYLVGFSLGGNFALRVSQEAKHHHLKFNHIAAISPVFSPTETMHALEHGSAIYRKYFIKKWKRALRLKASHFPNNYNFDDLLASKSLSTMTETLVTKYTQFKTVDEYFNSYTLFADKFESILIKTDVILSADDPVIPLSGTLDFSSTEFFTLRIFKEGGHCGFIQNWRFESWIDQELVKLFS